MSSVLGLGARLEKMHPSGWRAQCESSMLCAGFQRVGATVLALFVDPGTLR